MISELQLAFIDEIEADYPVQPFFYLHWRDAFIAIIQSECGIIYRFQFNNGTDSVSEAGDRVNLTVGGDDAKQTLTVLGELTQGLKLLMLGLSVESQKILLRTWRSAFCREFAASQRLLCSSHVCFERAMREADAACRDRLRSMWTSDHTEQQHSQTRVIHVGGSHSDI